VGSGLAVCGDATGAAKVRSRSGLFGIRFGSI
jgi:hypothetical protein